jgi:putative SOS response-associated peptidase YedK
MLQQKNLTPCTNIAPTQTKLVFRHEEKERHFENTHV